MGTVEGVLVKRIFVGEFDESGRIVPWIEVEDQPSRLTVKDYMGWEKDGAKRLAFMRELERGAEAPSRVERREG
jgi:hypothetical protein